MTMYPESNCMQYENNNMKSGTFFTLFNESSREYDSDEREGSINYNKEQDDQNANVVGG